MTDERRRWCDKHSRWECPAHHAGDRAKPCHNPLGEGQLVCWKHGGNAPQVKAAALARQARLGLGFYAPGRPDQILLEEIARTHGIVLWLERRLAEQPPEALTWGTSEERETAEETPDGRNLTLTRTRRAGPSALLAWYERERRHLAVLTTKAAEIGIADRLVSLVKEQAEMMNGALRALLERLDLTEAQWRVADTAVPELMARVAAPDGQAM